MTAALHVVVGGSNGGDVDEQLSLAAHVHVEQCQLPHEKAGCFFLSTFMSASNGGSAWPWWWSLEESPTILDTLKKCSKEDWAGSVS